MKQQLLSDWEHFKIDAIFFIDDAEYIVYTVELIVECIVVFVYSEL